MCGVEHQVAVEHRTLGGDSSIPEKIAQRSIQHPRGNKAAIGHRQLAAANGRHPAGCGAGCTKGCTGGCTDMMRAFAVDDELLATGRPN